MQISTVRYKSVNVREDPAAYLKRRLQELGEKFAVEVIKNEPAGETLFVIKKIKINSYDTQENYFTAAHELGHVVMGKTWWINILILGIGAFINILGGVLHQTTVMWINPLLGLLLAYRKYLDEKKAFDFAKSEMTGIISEEDLKALYTEDLRFARVCAVAYYLFTTAALFACWGGYAACHAIICLILGK